ncbi:MAG: response regulator transcription factor [Chitinophagaceae bacterium]|nr:response regulator transcription factor [Chitinophagaceae bacterium]
MEAASILIVEDERKIADTLKNGLVENGYEVEVAYDGETGLQLFSDRKFQMILIDINLPGINGIDLCRAIRQKDASACVIMLTSMKSISDKLEGFDAGTDDYLAKPFEFRELLMRIRAVLKRSRVRGASVLRAPNMEMRLDSREVIRGEQKINLTVKEFQLLEFLMQNQNKVLSRAEIATNVWGINFDTNTNVIDVYINYLRNKIDKHFEPRLIHTHFGMGYILKSKAS